MAAAYAKLRQVGSKQALITVKAVVFIALYSLSAANNNKIRQGFCRMNDPTRLKGTQACVFERMTMKFFELGFRCSSIVSESRTVTNSPRRRHIA